MTQRHAIVLTMLRRAIVSKMQRLTIVLKVFVMTPRHAIMLKMLRHAFVDAAPRQRAEDAVFIRPEADEVSAIGGSPPCRPGPVGAPCSAA